MIPISLDITTVILYFLMCLTGDFKRVILTFIIIIILHICVIFIIFVPVKTIRTMAKLNVIAKFIRNGGINDGFILRITRNKQGLRGSIFNKRKKKICSCLFLEKDRDDTIYRVMEYFNFNGNNSYRL